jgi:hypothetical protein
MIDGNIPGELLRAANALDRVPRVEVRSMLLAAIVAIRDLRLSVGIPGSGTSSDAVIGLLEAADCVEVKSEDGLRRALLDAVDMIRTLRIVADSGIELTLAEAELAP